jgi:hypothetical protein
MVKGFELFKERFSEFGESFIVIGGTACDLNLSRFGGFRRTKDIDIMVLTENVSDDFASALHGFLREGGYSCYVSRDSKPHYYRFLSPENDSYPWQIEMLSHSLLPERADAPFTPISLDEGVRSLSAIVLDEEYYEYAKEHRDFSAGVPCLSTEALVAFKSSAYLSLLSDREQNPALVRSEDLNKHRNDVFRLVSVMSGDVRFELPHVIKERLANFLTLFPADSEEWGAIRSSIGAMALSPEVYIKRIKEIFSLDEVQG